MGVCADIGEGRFADQQGFVIPLFAGMLSFFFDEFDRSTMRCLRIRSGELDCVD